MNDETKLHDIKTNLQECIDIYEEKVSQLKEYYDFFNQIIIYKKIYIP